MKTNNPAQQDAYGSDKGGCPACHEGRKHTAKELADNHPFAKKQETNNA